MLNTLFIFVIIGVAIAAGIFEVMAIGHYCSYQCGPTAKAIDYLKKFRKTGGNGLNLDENMKRWFHRHFEGEFRGNLFIPKEDGDSFVMISSPTVVSKPVPRGPVYFAPTLLTALGVLGTFTGIYFGLQGVNLNAIQETETLLKTSTDLLAGMKFAFLTSLWGLGTASGFMLFLAAGGWVRQQRRDSLRSELSKVAFLLTPGRILARMTPGATGGESNLTAAAIGQAVAKEMRSVLRSELTPIFEPLTNLTPEAIGKATGTQLNPALNSMQAELSSIRALQEKQGQAVDYLVTRLREELIEPVVKRLDETAKLTKEASEAVKELKTAMAEITKELAEAVKNFQKVQKETLDDLKEFAGSLAAILDKFRDETRGVLLTVAEEIKRAVAESIKGMEAQREAFKESADQAAANFIGIRVELEQSLRVQAELQKEMLEKVEASTRKVLEDANKAFISQSETLVTIGREASALMNEAAAHLVTTLENVDEMLQKTRITVQEELEKFRDEYQKSLTKFFEDQNNLLDETLRKQREGLEIVITKLQTVFLEDAPKMGEVIKEAMRYMQETMGQMQGTMASIQETAKIVYNLAHKTGLTSGERLQQLHEMIGALGSEAKQIESAYQNMVEKFDTSLNNSLNLMVERLNEALQIGNKQLMEYLQKANESYIKAIKEGDSAAAEVCNQLNQTSHGLMDVSHYLVASAKELKNGNGSGS
ncbi:hypothetical protein [Oscillatoria acuminata]|uniref:MotA/TolQ/ExbB proton channel domain-containing protein n=1 Tax=Oscillatoria acuminata PCC 6304 TaxID=56110 RepID=K9TMB5_9CYAN|nr:hypothetical protein [Oscillatoria acuminata]AFY83271.1 hypothetical protein Oscil6304_3711 [Oscillatoria acuminata PCC 6304]